MLHFAHSPTKKVAICAFKREKDVPEATSTAREIGHIYICPESGAVKFVVPRPLHGVCIVTGSLCMRPRPRRGTVMVS